MLKLSIDDAVNRSKDIFLLIQTYLYCICWGYQIVMGPRLITHFISTHRQVGRVEIALFRCRIGVTGRRPRAQNGTSSNSARLAKNIKVCDFGDYFFTGSHYFICTQASSRRSHILSLVYTKERIWGLLGKCNERLGREQISYVYSEEAAHQECMHQPKRNHSIARSISIGATSCKSTKYY